MTMHFSHKCGIRQVNNLKYLSTAHLDGNSSQQSVLRRTRFALIFQNQVSLKFENQSVSHVQVPTYCNRKTTRNPLDRFKTIGILFHLYVILTIIVGREHSTSGELSLYGWSPVLQVWIQMLHYIHAKKQHIFFLGQVQS